MGDRILSVNGIDIRGVSHQDAVLALLSKKDSMKMTVQHDPLPSGFRVGSLIITWLKNERRLICTPYTTKNKFVTCYYCLKHLFSLGGCGEQTI